MLRFYITEMFKSFGRARLSFVISLITTTIAVFLVTMSSLLFFWSSMLTEQFNKKTSFNLFLDEQADDESFRTDLLGRIRGYEFTESIRFIDKQEARKQFLQQTGEDFSEVLDYNPLPQSIELRIKSSYLNKDSIRTVSSVLRSTRGVEEVVFEAGIIYKALDFISSLKFYILIASAALVIISLYIVYSTNRLIIQARWRQIETMKLVGARLSAIKIPIYLTGIFIGIISSLITFTVLRLLLAILGDDMVLMDMNTSILVIFTVFLGGPAIGMVGSIFASRKISLKIHKLIF